VLCLVWPGATAHRGGGLPQTVLGQPPGLRPAGSAHWLKRSGRPARRECVCDNIGRVQFLLHSEVKVEELTGTLVLRDCDETLIQQVFQAEVVK
jgi:hypothetical protein